jgi:hypothetical protein
MTMTEFLRRFLGIWRRSAPHTEQDVARDPATIGGRDGGAFVGRVGPDEAASARD